MTVKVRRIIKFEFEGGHDIEFVPSETQRNVWEVWLDGVMLEELPQGEKPSLVRAWYYWEVHFPELEKSMEEPVLPTCMETLAAAVH